MGIKEGEHRWCMCTFILWYFNFLAACGIGLCLHLKFRLFCKRNDKNAMCDFFFLKMALKAFSFKEKEKGQFPFYHPSYLPAPFVQVGLSEEGNSCCVPRWFGGWKDASCS